MSVGQACAAEGCGRKTRAKSGFCPEHKLSTADTSGEIEESEFGEYLQRLDEEKLAWLEGRLAAHEVGQSDEGVGPELEVARLIVERLLALGKEVEASRATLVVAKLVQTQRQLAGKGHSYLMEVIDAALEKTLHNQVGEK